MKSVRASRNNRRQGEPAGTMCAGTRKEKPTR
jgi:hypothetical protein